MQIVGKLEKKFGVSDNYLIKLCKRRMSISIFVLLTHFSLIKICIILVLILHTSKNNLHICFIITKMQQLTPKLLNLISIFIQLINNEMYTIRIYAYFVKNNYLKTTSIEIICQFDSHILSIRARINQYTDFFAFRFLNYIELTNANIC